MAFQKSLAQPFRKNNLTTGSGWRGFFAPFNITLASQTSDLSVGPTILDLMANGPFTDNALPAGWRDVGWIKEVVPTPGTKIGQVRSGFHGVVKVQYKGEISETVEFKMREITRMALKIATGSDVFNLLDAPTPNTVGPLSASGGAAVAFVSYDPDDEDGPTVVVSPASSASGFAAGDYIVVDKDYNPATFGLIGENATPVFQGSVTDTEYIRKTSDFVARVKSSSALTGEIILNEKFTGGGSGDPVGNTVPQAGSKVQKIKGFASREGGTYIMDWSALFLLDTIDGAQFAFYYPHLSTVQFRGMPTWAIENIGNTDFTGYELDAVMNALAFDDPLDGQPVTSYRSFYPRGRRQDIAI